MNITGQYRHYIQQLGRVICPPPFLHFSIFSSFLFFFFSFSLLSCQLFFASLSSQDIIGRVFLDYLLFVLSFFCFCSSIFLLSELPALARALPCAVNNLHDSPIILLSNDHLIGLQKRRDNTLNNVPTIIPSSSSYPALSVSCARVVQGPWVSGQTCDRLA